MRKKRQDETSLGLPVELAADAAVILGHVLKLGLTICERFDTFLLPVRLASLTVWLSGIKL
jgi:hypothetical protein